MPETSALNIPHSPIAALGTITLLIAYVVAAYAVAAGIIGNVQNRRRLVASSVYSLYGFFALMMLASSLIIYAFVTHDYTIKYVARYSDTTMPLYYKIAAYWGGLDGSLMFWVAVLSVFAAIAIRLNRERHRDMIGYVVAVIMIVQVFFLSLLVYDKNPFATFLTTPPIDGKGLNPLLQTYWMVIHPPSLYIGFVAATIPFSFGIGALASGRLDDRWLRSVRVWTFICWFFLGFGLVLGGRWAYEELGWGGYWAWDPVENAGLLPWLTATAFLHSVIIQEQRGMMKMWNLVLVIVTFFLTIFGTFMTRSGVVQSVHAFGEDNKLALLFILFMAFILVVSFGLLLFRQPQLRSRTSFESFLSREYAFLLNNWILLGCAFFVLFATMFPTLSEAVTGERITVGPPFFNKWMIPFGMILLFLAGAAPLLAWRRTTRSRLWGQFAFPVAVAATTIGGLAIFMPQTRVLTTIFTENVKLPVSLVNFGLVSFTISCVLQEFWKGTKVRMKQTDGDAFTSLVGLTLAKRRKYGGYIIHMGVATLFFGFGGKAYEAMEDRTLDGVNQSFQVREYTFTYKALITKDNDHMRSVAAHVVLSKDGSKITDMYPEKRIYKKSDEQPTTEVDIKSFLSEDVYIILTGFEEDKKVANFRVYINPLINWVWIGFGIVAFGTFICLIPGNWIRRMSPAGYSSGKATLILLAAGAISFGSLGTALAQGGEYQEAKHNVGASAAHLFRPDDSKLTEAYREAAIALVKENNPGLTERDPAFEQKVVEAIPAVGVARKLMSDIVCLCGGCQRETILECRCGYAAGEREKVIGQLVAFDLTSDDGRDKAYKAVVDTFMTRHGQRVLTVPIDTGFNRLAWAVPYALFTGALIMLISAGRRWVKRGREVEASRIASLAAGNLEDEDYADILDDELRDTD